MQTRLKMVERVLGIIGGSGVYAIDGLADTRWETIESPFGKPSDQLLFGNLAGQKLVFLPRHGRGHKLPPSEINYRANIDALKRAGVTEILSVSAVGSLKEELPPGCFVIVDQFIDRTFAREKSFFGGGLVAHVGMGHPVCGRLSDHLAASAFALGLQTQKGGTYLAMEGPQFSTLAESRLYRSWGCDVIGMTNMPEAKLAREAELCYASVAMVTDYDCWHPDHDHVSVDSIVATLHANADNARALIKAVAPLLAGDGEPCRQGCDHALDTAIITAPDARDPAMLAKLDAVAGRVLR
jgi:5'-methylthioadenosine phosphorylase